MLATVAEAQTERVQREQWDTTAELLAVLIEVLDRNGIWFFQANAEKGSAAPEPIAIHRPGKNGTEPEPPRPATAAEMKAFFGGAVQYTP